jgi:hypothetical protein
LQLYDWINYPTYNGYFSDRTWTKLGRKPYFWQALFSFGCIIYYAQFSFWFAAGMVMDASINVSMGLFVLLLAIIFRQQTKGFANAKFFFFFFIGILPISSKLPLILPSRCSNSSSYIPDSVKYSFYFGVYYSLLLYWMIQLKEYSPEELEALKNTKKLLL